MKQAINKEGVYSIACKTIDTKKGEVVELMQRYGMNVSIKDEDAKIMAAFSSLVPRSRAFRNDFSVLATDVAKDMSLADVNMAGYMNADGTFLVQPKGTFATSAAATTSNSPKAFDQTKVGQILSNDAIKNLINTGLGVWAYNKTGGTMGSQDNILNSATVGGGVTSSPTPVAGGSDQKADAKDKGIGIGTIAVIAITGVALMGLVIYMTNKGGKK